MGRPLLPESDPPQGLRAHPLELPFGNRVWLAIHEARVLGPREPVPDVVLLVDRYRGAVPEAGSIRCERSRAAPARRSDPEHTLALSSELDRQGEAFRPSHTSPVPLPQHGHVLQLTLRSRPPRTTEQPSPRRPIVILVPVPRTPPSPRRWSSLPLPFGETVEPRPALLNRCPFELQYPLPVPDLDFPPSPPSRGALRTAPNR